MVTTGLSEAPAVAWVSVITASFPRRNGALRETTLGSRNARSWRGHHWRGRGGWVHHGRSSWEMRATHLTQWYPRLPGTTRRAGEPCAADSGTPPTAVARSRSAVRGRRREEPVALVTSTLPRVAGGSSR